MSERNGYHSEAVTCALLAARVSSFAIDRDDLDKVPFNQIGGLGRACELFGEQLAAILEELNARSAA